MHRYMLIVFGLMLPFHSRYACSLTLGFYAKQCPGAEKVVSRIVWLASRRDPSLPAALLRLHYHDCFVDGCDGSVLLDSAFGYPTPEKAAPPNQSLRGFVLVDSIKRVLEDICPSIVSCADILALAARDAVVFAGGPRWEVPTGRRDGKLSSAMLATISLPHPQSSISELKTNFLLHGMSEEEMITLSGAHTIGSAGCTSVWHRLYNFNNTMGIDPSMSSHYAAHLKKICPKQNRNQRLIVPLDPVTPFKFDNMYYKNLQKGLGLLASDQIIFNVTISEFINNSSIWEESFRNAMVHMSSLDVKEGLEGEIRRNCRTRN